VLSLAWTAPAALHAQRATRQQQVVVGVSDRGGKPIAGLTPADFVVREDDVAREILSVQQASAPMQVVVLVDTSNEMQIALHDVRAAIERFAKALWAKSPESTISVMEFGERPALLQAPTSSATALADSVAGLAEHAGSGAYLLDTIVEAANALENRHAERPVIVAFVRDTSEEFSRRLAQQVEAPLKAARASLWAFVLQENGSTASSTIEMRQRDIVLGDVAPRTGGTREMLLNRMAIGPQFDQLAARLTSQYVVTYGRPESLIPPTRIEVTVKRAGARVQAARWAAQ
jgi:VWFA-related protein